MILRKAVEEMANSMGMPVESFWCYDENYSAPMNYSTGKFSSTKMPTHKQYLATFKLKGLESSVVFSPCLSFDSEQAKKELVAQIGTLKEDILSRVRN